MSEGIDYLIVSNASTSIGLLERKSALSLINLKRILDISLDQVAALRSRSIIDFIKRTGQGMYLKIGSSAEMITTTSMCRGELAERLVKQCLSAAQTQQAMNYKTTLKKPSALDFQMLLRHGYEVADCTYQCYTKYIS